MKKTLASVLLISVFISICACSGAEPAVSSVSEDTAGSSVKTAEDIKPYVASDIAVGDHISFGDYKGHSTWRVLDIRGTEAYIVSEDIVEQYIFDESFNVWSNPTCAVRTWLNGEYLNQAFTPEEQDKIVEKDGDKVLLMSIAEAYRYFRDDKDRYTKGAVLDGQEMGYWLRDTGIVSDHAAMVDGDGVWGGSVSEYGAAVYYEWGVRPSMWIRIKGIANDRKGIEKVSEDGFFTLVQTGDSLELTGLTEEGKKQESLVIPAGVKIFGRITDGSAKNVVFESDEDIDIGFLLAGSKTLETVSLPGKLTNLPRFSTCDHLKEITIPEGIKTIPRLSFEFDSKLEKVTIKGNVTEIGDRAFISCESLNSITIPDSVTRIGDVAFNGCVSLKEITLPPNLKEIGWGAFCYTGITTITVPAEMELVKWDVEVFKSIDAKAFGTPEIEYKVRVRKGSWADMHFDEVFGAKAVREYY